MTETKHRFNVIDLCFLLIILAVAAFILIGNASQKEDAVESENIVFYLQISDVSEDYVNKIAVGDKVFNHDDGSLIGYVVEVSENTPDALFKAGYHDNEYYITVKASGQKADIGYLVNGTNINTGNNLQVRFPNLYCEAVCVGVKPLTD